MTTEEYQKTRQFMEKIALELMDHEGKPIITAALPIQNYTTYNIQGRTFYSMESNLFKEIIRDKYIKVHENSPTNFGTGNAHDVLQAFYDCENIFDFEKFISILKEEQCAYIIEIQNGKIIDRILRIDLFRQLDFDKQGQPEFTGGIFHVLKHFSIAGRNLSTGKDINDLMQPEDIIPLVIEAFFIAQGEMKTPSKLVSKINWNDRYILKFVFYLEEKTQIFFVRTIHKKKIVKTKGDSDFKIND